MLKVCFLPHFPSQNIRSSRVEGACADDETGHYRGRLARLHSSPGGASLKRPDPDFVILALTYGNSHLDLHSLPRRLTAGAAADSSAISHGGSGMKAAQRRHRPTALSSARTPTRSKLALPVSIPLGSRQPRTYRSDHLPNRLSRRRPELTAPVPPAAAQTPQERSRARRPHTRRIDLPGRPIETGNAVSASPAGGVCSSSLPRREKVREGPHAPASRCTSAFANLRCTLHTCCSVPSTAALHSAAFCISAVGAFCPKRALPKPSVERRARPSAGAVHRRRCVLVLRVGRAKAAAMRSCWVGWRCWAGSAGREELPASVRSASSGRGLTAAL